MLLKPFTFRDPDRIVMFQNTFRRAPQTSSAASTELNWWRRHSDAFEDVSAYGFNIANLTGESLPEQAYGIDGCPSPNELRPIIPALLASSSIQPPRAQSGKINSLPDYQVPRLNG